MRNLSRKELNVIAKMRGIKGYKSMSEYKLLSAIKASESLKESEKPKTNFSKARIEKIRNKFNESRHKLSKSKINEIRRNLENEIENEKNLFASKIKEIERNITELEENISKTKKYYDYDDTEYKAIRDLKDLFDLLIEKDYYKSIITRGAFNNSYFQYESKGNKDKTLTPSEYLNMIRPYLSDITKNYKTHGKWRIHSGNTITEHEIQSEWKIQLANTINLISFKDSDETRTMHAKSNNVEIMMGSET